MTSPSRFGGLSDYEMKVHMDEHNIKVDQALFGYKRGHRLLYSSCRFSVASERTLLALTDMSGPRMISRFEEYLSGYPLAEERRYAFTKTWYAPEMERPGCVWTHALILRYSDFSSITGFGQLRTRFTHPSDVAPSKYSEPIYVEPCDSASGLSDPVARSHA